MSPAKPKVEVAWTIVTVEDFRTSLPLMLKFKKLNQEGLGWLMGKGVVCRTLFSAFLLGKQNDVKLSSFLDAMEAMELEVVVRRKTDKADRRRAALVAEREAAKAEQAKDAKRAELAEQGRDADGKLKVLTPQVRAEVDELLDKYGSF